MASFTSLLITVIKDIGVYWRTFVFILTPILLLPLPLLLPSSEANCGYVLVLMAVYWITETLPLAVTALLPLLLFPILGLMKGKDVAGLYIADTSVVFIASLMMALAIEKVMLHKRIGLGILVLLGSKPTRLLIGFMLPTWFLSMWISNTATTAMMIPVAQSVIVQLKEGVRLKRDKQRAKKKAIFQLEEVNDRMKMENGGAYNHTFIEDDLGETTYFGGDGEYLSPKNLTNGITLAYLPPKSTELPASASATQCSMYDDMSTVTIGTNEEDKRSRIDEKELKEEEGKEDDDDDAKSESEEIEDRQIKKFAMMLSLAVAYSSNVGGTATLTGTPTNLLVAEKANEIWESHNLPAPLTYTTWLFFGLPHAVLCLLVTWAWLQLVFMGWRPFCFCCVDSKLPHNDEGITNTLKEEYRQLGRISFGEVSAIVFLLIMIILWFTRDPGFAPGYASLFKDGYVTDAAPAILMAVLLFVWPSQVPNWMCFRSKENRTSRATRVPAMLDWPTVSTKLPWGPILLLGGGFALAKGVDVSELDVLIGEQLATLAVLPAWSIALIVTILVSFVTEITSNSAVISIMLPILEAMAHDLGINPLYLMLPAGMAASYAFMLPIATPPNAIVFSYGHLKIINMASVGFAVNIFCICVVTLGINTWGMALFHLDTIPWDTTNSTTTTLSAVVSTITS